MDNIEGSMPTSLDHATKRKLDEVLSLFKEMTEPIDENVNIEPKRKIMRVTRANYQDMLDRESKVKVSYNPTDYKSFMERLSTYDISFS
ncbi:hypothetical protein G9A89_008734 [Geosiphon pyriformis]|nr:hypothetical protein G9A89_008734 [Geosiphon pyriformis]